MCPNQDTAQFSMAGPALVGKPLTDDVIKVSVGGRANLGVFALRFRHVVGYIGTAEYQHVSLRSEQVYSQPRPHIMRRSRLPISARDCTSLGKVHALAHHPAKALPARSEARNFLPA